MPPLGAVGDNQLDSSAFKPCYFTGVHISGNSIRLTSGQHFGRLHGILRSVAGQCSLDGVSAGSWLCSRPGYAVERPAGGGLNAGVLKQLLTD